MEVKAMRVYRYKSPSSATAECGKCSIQGFTRIMHLNPANDSGHYIISLPIARICRVLKAWHLYTHALQDGMVKGRRNKVLKLTPAKVKYIIRAKTNNISSRIIATEMKASIRTVNRVWEYWMKNKEPLAPKKFGRPNIHYNELTWICHNFFVLAIHSASVSTII